MNVLKVTFARHGIPAILRSDNEPQFDLSEMKSFALSYGFGHKQSSQRYPQSNGQVERGIQTIKNLLRKADDVSLSLSVGISIHSTWCDKSPAELCKEKKLWTADQSSATSEWSDSRVVIS